MAGDDALPGSSTGDRLALYLPEGAIAPPTNPYGRLIANAGTYRALARHGGYRSLHVQSRAPRDPAELAAELGVDPDAMTITAGSLVGTRAAGDAGILLSGQPYLTEPAWVRHHAGQDLGYSIAGTIFAFASATHREQMLHSLLAPLHPWDALICSSPTLQRSVIDVIDRWQDYLEVRLGSGRGHGRSDISLPRPQLPVIPFGCDVPALAGQGVDQHARATLRRELGIGADEVMVFYLGRLSYYDKAFPQAMFKAVQVAARGTEVGVHFVLAGWFAGGEPDRARFAAAARRYAPDVRVTFLDGNDQPLVARCWAGADVFLQLSDTILETFGQAVVEAMAAAVPVVVSDWDGFRFIVRDGEDGYLVPTLGAGPGPLGRTLALAQTVGMADYPGYVGAVAQHTAVHVGRAAQALRALLESPDLRRRMGAAGQRRARTTFDWPVVVDQYRELFADLAQLRREAAGSSSDVVALGQLNPLRDDPRKDFATLPTEVLDDATWIRLLPADAVVAVAPNPDPAIDLDQMFPELRGSPAEAEEVRRVLADGTWQTVADVLGGVAPRRRPFLRGTIMWLAKAGAIDWHSGTR